MSKGPSMNPSGFYSIGILSPKISTMLRLDLNLRSSKHKRAHRKINIETTKPTEEPDTSKSRRKGLKTRIDLDLPPNTSKRGQ
ncbi:hypothetical protein CEXT_365931 [Caerostris extrusa]|uniref:Uncharacterized protein n=1 Tax=Caerostris extrusa TaxID=172846 RepID=A0AAV4VKB5_CAEEX|nr:hypothetical protein CEXT_365931 [Caerostris extrusa]